MSRIYQFVHTIGFYCLLTAKTISGMRFFASINTDDDIFEAATQQSAFEQTIPVSCCCCRFVGRWISGRFCLPIISSSASVVPRLSNGPVTGFLRIHSKKALKSRAYNSSKMVLCDFVSLQKNPNLHQFIPCFSRVN